MIKVVIEKDENILGKGEKLMLATSIFFFSHNALRSCLETWDCTTNSRHIKDKSKRFVRSSQLPIISSSKTQRSANHNKNH